MTQSDVTTLLFDLDGTLLDSFPAHLAAFMKTFAACGIPMTEAAFRELYTPDWFAVYRAAGLPEEAWERADAIWLAEAHRQRPDLFPGIKPLLAALNGRYRLGLVTSGSADRVRRDLARVGLAERFEVVITAADVQAPKPAPEGVLLALARMGAARETAVYVGDTVADCQTARAAEVPFVGIVSQFSGREPDPACFQFQSVQAWVDAAGLLTASPRPGQRPAGQP